ncbi:MAG TPA: GMC family oxidoreductase N-terminal domain-containing protein [Candidatus Limnocylindrales bacterium]|nr:GMC family oxidoreductase N-terminal domain-containing protein [Candidatus Limnocylindrales bacterium]
MAQSKPWADAEVATLAEIAETFVRGDAQRRARLTVEALERAADPAQVDQLRLVLRLVQSGLANAALGRTSRPFRELSPAGRERYLLSWATSPIPLKRSAFHGFRKLLTFLAYADPGGDTPNPRLAEIGYQPDDPPITADRTTIRPLRPPFETGSPDEPMTLEADAVVVGSGAGGGVIAAALADAGRSVVILEAGPFVDEATMPRDELDAYGRAYLNYGLLATWDGSITMLSGSAVGGGTLVNWMTSLPAPDWVREDWRRDHAIEGITDASWEADVAAVEGELGVAEAVVIPPKDQVILRGAEALGWEAGPTRRNATDCGDCGSCPFGCRRGTKQSGIRVHLAAAHAAGARIVERARATRVLISGGAAVGVEANALWTDPTTGEPDEDGRTRRLVVRAPVVVAAGGALRTPALLSGSGLGHRSIGRHLRLHPVPVVAAIYPDAIYMWRGTMQGARSLEFARPGDGSNGYVIESAPGHPGLMALALPWEGTDAHRDLMLRARRIGPLIAVTRDGGEGRTTVTKAGRVRVDYRLDASGIATMRHGLLSMARLARAAGAPEIVAVATRPARYQRPRLEIGGEAQAFARFEEELAAFDFSPNRGGVFSAHQMGSARMGASVGDHPCDPWGRVRRDDRSDTPIRGLYVGDGSLFPTGIGVNPQITIMALARRVARTIAAES